MASEAPGADMTTAQAPPAGAAAMRRLRRELEAIEKAANPQITVRPSSNNLLEWHFALHDLPADTVYDGGCYHGKIIFPREYPHAPPSIVMVTKSGRLEIGMRLCLSMTDFHPESWNPAWSVDTILVGFVSYFISDKERGFGSIAGTPEKRRLLAGESWVKNAADAEFCELFPELVERPVAREAEVACSVEKHDEANAPVHAEAVMLAAPPAEAAVHILPEERLEASFVLPQEGGIQSETGFAAAPEERTAAPEEEEPEECWICRDADLDEPLIHPCACRGSMSGVHASCVEQWIRHHRRNAVNDEVPKCSVCHQPYAGSEQRPGFRDFALQFSQNGCKVMGRQLALATTLVVFGWACSPECPLPAKILIISLFGLVTVHKSAALTASLPPNRLPPEQPWLRPFFVGDRWSVSMHIAEAFAGLVFLGVWCIFGIVGPLYYAPFALIIAVPFVKLSIENASWPCFKRAWALLAVFMLLPVILICILVALIKKYPNRVVHPLDAGWHVLIGIVTIPLALTVQSNVGIVLMWQTHCVFLFAAVVEIFCVKRLKWHEGVPWWFALQVTALAWYVVNTLCVFPKGYGEFNHSTDAVVFAVSTIWFLLFACLTVKVNWRLLVRYYRTWQARNGHFSLDNNAPQNGAGTAVAPLIEEV